MVRDEDAPVRSERPASDAVLSEPRQQGGWGPLVAVSGASLGQPPSSPAFRSNVPVPEEPSIVVDAQLFVPSRPHWSAAAPLETWRPAAPARRNAWPAVGVSAALALFVSWGATSQGRPEAHAARDSSSQPAVQAPEVVVEQVAASGVTVSQIPDARPQSARKRKERANEEPRPALPPEQLLSRAVTQLNEGKLAAARDTYQQLLKNRSHRAEAWVGLSHVALARGDASQAVSWARRAVEARPNEADTWTLLSEALRSQGDESGARQALRHADSLQPPGVMAAARPEPVAPQAQDERVAGFLSDPYGSGLPR